VKLPRRFFKVASLTWSSLTELACNDEGLVKEFCWVETMDILQPVRSEVLSCIPNKLTALAAKYSIYLDWWVKRILDDRYRSDTVKF
jgi:hypothetical protein